jgi:hypothetical protein
MERVGVRKRLLQGLLGSWLVVTSGYSSTEPEDRATVILVVGAPGEEDFGKRFEQWAGLWEKAGEQANANVITIGLTPSAGTNDLDRLSQVLDNEPKETTSELWLVLIGHGTFDGKEAKFNLRGPDLTATNCARLLQPFHRPIAVINAASASGPFINKLSAPGRVVITATKSGYEQNYARFGEFIAEAIANPQADLDKDGQTSLLEAFLIASRHTAEFYTTEGRLATEHALIDDNGDGLGTPADWFRGVRAVKTAANSAGVDGLRAHQIHLVRSEQERQLSPAVRARRDELEVAIAKLRETKGKTTEEEYYRQLEPLLLELARLYAPSQSGFE